MSEGQDRTGTVFGLPRRVAVGSALALFTLALAVAFSFAALAARTGARDLVAGAAECQLAVELVEAAVLDSHLELEEYVEDGLPRSRKQYERARSGVERALARLAEVAARMPDEEGRFPRVRAAASRMAAQQAGAAKLVAAGDSAAARALLVEDGPPPFAAVNAALEDLETSRVRAAADGAAWSARMAAISTAVFVAAEVLLLFFILFAARTVRNEVRARARAMEVQQRLMAMVSHDLRDPLSAVLGSAWSLQRRDLPPDASRAVQRIASSARRMHRLVRDVLDWSRAHAGAEIPVKAREVDLHELCERLAKELDPPAGERIRIACEGDPHAALDPDRMEQVIANLFTNALRYSPPDRPVRVRVSGTRDEVRLEVSDEGPGIPRETQAWIFEPFRSAAPGKGAGGGRLGLGLFIVRTLVVAHGGRVRVQSSPGEGTTFVVEVPRFREIAPVSGPTSRA